MWGRPSSFCGLPFRRAGRRRKPIVCPTGLLASVTRASPSPPDHSAQGHALGAFAQEQLTIVEPDCARDIQVYPRGQAGELLQEHGGGNRIGYVGETLSDNNPYNRPPAQIPISTHPLSNCAGRAVGIIDKMAKVFISHSSLDQGFAEEFAAELRRYGHEPLGDLALRVSTDWDTQLQNALADSDFVVFLFSEHAIGSENILAEVWSSEGTLQSLQDSPLDPGGDPWRRTAQASIAILGAAVACSPHRRGTVRTNWFAHPEDPAQSKNRDPVERTQDLPLDDLQRIVCLAADCNQLYQRARQWEAAGVGGAARGRRAFPDFCRACGRCLWQSPAGRQTISHPSGHLRHRLRPSSGCDLGLLRQNRVLHRGTTDRARGRR